MVTLRQISPTVATMTPLEEFHTLQMTAEWAAAGSLLSDEFAYQDLGVGTRLGKAAYLEEYARKYPDVWSDEPISSLTDLTGRKGLLCFASVSPDGRRFVVVSDAEWDAAGRLTTLREIWHQA